MANPFKQAELAKKTAPGSKKAEEKKETVVTEETPKVEEPVEVKPVEVKETKKTEQKKTEKKEKEVKENKDLFAGLKAEKKARGVACSFYLPKDVEEKLKKKAESIGISPSKLLTHILNEVL
jgi:hypothetical protein